MPRYSTPPGWPLIKTAMTPEEADSLHNYIIDLEWRAYKLAPRGVKSADSPEQ
jgi:hypothetical protein